MKSILKPLIYQVLITFLFAAIFLLSLFINFNIPWLYQFYPAVFQLSSFILGLAIAALFFKDHIKFQWNLLDFLVVFYCIYSILNKLGHLQNFQYDIHSYNQLAYMALYFAIRLLPKQELVFDSVVALIMFLGFSNIIYGILQVFGLAPLISTIYRITGTFPNPAPFAAYLAIIAPLSFLLFPGFASKKVNFIRTCLFVIFAIVIVYTASRAAFLALVVMGLAFTYRHYQDNIRKWKYWTIGIAMAASISLVTVLYAIRPASADGRLLIWKVTSKMITDAPTVGSGIGYFDDHYSRYQAAYLASEKASFNEKYLSGKVHFPFNEYLGIWVENGLMGLFLFLLMVCIPIYAVLKNRCKEGKLFFPVAGLVGLLIFALLSYPFHVTAISVVFFVILALISYQIDKLVLLGKINFKKAQPWFLSFGIAVYLFVSFMVIRQIEAIKLWHNAKDMVAYNTAASFKIYSDIKPLMTNNPSFLYNYGAEMADLGYYKLAIKLFEELKLKHQDINLYSQTGRCYEALKLYSLAEENYQKAADIRPLMLAAKLLLFRLFISSGNEEKAKEQAKIILDTPVKIPTLEAEKIRNDMRLYLMDH